MIYRLAIGDSREQSHWTKFRRQLSRCAVRSNIVEMVHSRYEGNRPFHGFWRHIGWGKTRLKLHWQWTLWRISDHMVQKPPYWNANCALVHLKTKLFNLILFVLDAPVGNLRSSMAVFVPCDHCPPAKGPLSRYAVLRTGLFEMVHSRYEGNCDETSTYRILSIYNHLAFATCF